MPETQRLHLQAWAVETSVLTACGDAIGSDDDKPGYFTDASFMPFIATLRPIGWKSSSYLSLSKFSLGTDYLDVSFFLWLSSVTVSCE